MAHVFKWPTPFLLIIKGNLCYFYFSEKKFTKGALILWRDDRSIIYIRYLTARRMRKIFFKRVGRNLSQVLCFFILTTASFHEYKASVQLYKMTITLYTEENKQYYHLDNSYFQKKNINSNDKRIVTQTYNEQ